MRGASCFEVDGIQEDGFASD